MKFTNTVKNFAVCVCVKVAKKRVKENENKITTSKN